MSTVFSRYTQNAKKAHRRAVRELERHNRQARKSKIMANHALARAVLDILPEQDAIEENAATAIPWLVSRLDRKHSFYVSLEENVCSNPLVIVLIFILSAGSIALAQAIFPALREEDGIFHPIYLGFVVAGVIITNVLLRLVKRFATHKNYECEAEYNVLYLLRPHLVRHCFALVFNNTEMRRLLPVILSRDARHSTLRDKAVKFASRVRDHAETSENECNLIVAEFEAMQKRAKEG